MDMENNYEEEIKFQIEVKNTEDKSVKTKRILKATRQSLKKLTLDRISGKIGEC